MDDRRSASRSGDGPSPSYCPNCGERLAAAANFCPNCGADAAAPGRSDGRSTADREETSRAHDPSIPDREVLEYRIEKAIEAGWELEHDFGDRAVVVRRSVGDLGVHVLLVLLTGGVGNVVYALYRYSSPDRVVLRADQRAGGRSQSGEGSKRLSWWGGGLTALVLWLGAAIMVAFAGATSSAVPTALFAATAAALALGGVGVLPPVKRRLSNRRSPTKNGRVRSVDERAVVDPDEPCTACANPIDRGVERTYREEFALLGVPLTVTEEGTNHYCRRCANAEFAANPNAAGDDSESALDSELEFDREN